MNDREFGPGGGKFDPTRYLRQLRGRGGSSDYLDVKWRLVWLRSEHPDAQISTEHVSIGVDSAVFKATVAIPGGGSATGYGSETKGDFGDFIEKAETKALGRALLALGYGTQFAQDFGDEDLPAAESGPRPRDSAPIRPVAPAGNAPARQPAPERISPAPRPTPAEPAAEARRPTPVRPLREAGVEDEAPAAPPARPESAPRAPQPVPRPAEDDDDFGRVVGAGPARATDTPAAASRPAARLSPPQPAPRPAPVAAPADERDGDDEIDMANYGWTEFWSWARSRGFNDRKALDAAVGRSTNGMTPLEIRKQIQAKQD